MLGIAPDAAATRSILRVLPRRAWPVVWFAAIAGVFWLGHRQGERVAGYDAAGSARERRALQADLARLEARNEKLSAKVAELEMARRLDREAYGQIERTLGDLQSRLARQSDDLDFYRTIVSPADGVQGLRIQRLAIRPGGGPREFVIEMTLIQAMRQDDVISGTAQVVIQGMQGGRPAQHTVGELSGQPRARLPFSFRYFQTIEHAITLPDGFQPIGVEVQAQSSRSRSTVKQSFTWTVFTGADGGPSDAAEPPSRSVR